MIGLIRVNLGLADLLLLQVNDLIDFGFVDCHVARSLVVVRSARPQSNVHFAGDERVGWPVPGDDLSDALARGSGGCTRNIYRRSRVPDRAESGHTRRRIDCAAGHVGEGYDAMQW